MPLELNSIDWLDVSILLCMEDSDYFRRVNSKIRRMLLYPWNFQRGLVGGAKCPKAASYRVRPFSTP